MNRICFLLLCTVVGNFFLSATASQARLGQRIKLFKLKQKEHYKLSKILVQDELKYYSFNILLDSEQLESAPGFKGGLTITVCRGIIIGQSLAISLGSNPYIGTSIACQKSFEFACETLGRPMPTETKQNQEKMLVQQAISFALSGQPQELKFPDTEGKIVFKRSADGNLLVAATKEQEKAEH